MDLMLGRGEGGKEEIKDGSIFDSNHQTGGCSPLSGKTELGCGWGGRGLILDMWVTSEHSSAASE